MLDVPCRPIIDPLCVSRFDKNSDEFDNDGSLLQLNNEQILREMKNLNDIFGRLFKSIWVQSNLRYIFTPLQRRCKKKNSKNIIQVKSRKKYVEKIGATFFFPDRGDLNEP